MGAGDAPRSDVERLATVRRSARGVDQRGLPGRQNPGPLAGPWRCRPGDRGVAACASRRASASACYRRWPVGSPFDPS
jgi:hypothetical protein